ncbi:hypothetical protein, partial [Neisseria sicca]|uniref:hypothetical protein n=1 Tax=Neisseria sicca TaxID=490 RepID=UPI0011BCFBB5
MKKGERGLEGIDVKVNDENVKRLSKDDCRVKFVKGTGRSGEKKGGSVRLNVKKCRLRRGGGGVVRGDRGGDVFGSG